jgi:hypothetical protein
MRTGRFLLCSSQRYSRYVWNIILKHMWHIEILYLPLSTAIYRNLPQSTDVSQASDSSSLLFHYVNHEWPLCIKIDPRYWTWSPMFAVVPWNDRFGEIFPRETTMCNAKFIGRSTYTVRGTKIMSYLYSYIFTSSRGFPHPPVVKINDNYLLRLLLSPTPTEYLSVLSI